MWCGARLANKAIRTSLHDKKNPRGRSRCDDRDALQLSKGSYVRGIAHIIAIIGAASSPWRGNLVPLYPVLSFVVLGDTICPYRVGRGRASVRPCVRGLRVSELRGESRFVFAFSLLAAPSPGANGGVESGEWREGRRETGRPQGRGDAENDAETAREGTDASLCSA